MGALSESEILSVARDLVTKILKDSYPTTAKDSVIDRQSVLEVYNILNGYPKNGPTMGGFPIQIDPGLPVPMLIIGKPKRL